MNRAADHTVVMSTTASRRAGLVSLAVLAFLVTCPLWMLADTVDKLTTLFIYVILAVMWNALAGYSGQVSVGQQAFFGLGAYATVRLSRAGLNVYVALLLGVILAGLSAIPVSLLVMRLRGGAFAICMWVIAEIFLLLTKLDHKVGGGTGTSLIALNRYSIDTRREIHYWLALGVAVGSLGAVLWLLRSRVGVALQAVRDDEEGAASLGVPVTSRKQIVFVIAALGCAAAGALRLATDITFQPTSFYSVQWTAYMIFMVLVGGLGTFEGPIVGAIVFFLVQTEFGDQGVWYLVGLGAAAVLFSIVLPRGLFGTAQRRWNIHLLPIGRRVVPVAAAAPTPSTEARSTT